MVRLNFITLAKMDNNKMLNSPALKLKAILIDLISYLISSRLFPAVSWDALEILKACFPTC